MVEPPITIMIAPDVIGVRASGHPNYPVELVVQDHDLGRLVLKLTGSVARILGHDLRMALIGAGETIKR